MAILWYGPADAIGFPLILFTGNAQAIYEKSILSVVFATNPLVTLTVLAYLTLFWIVILLALYGLWKERKNKLVWLVLLPVIYGTLFYPFFLVSPRYKEPLLPLVFVVAGCGWMQRKEIWARLRKLTE